MNDHIILEVDGKVAKDCGWQGPVEGVRVWVLDEYEPPGAVARRAAAWHGKARRGRIGFGEVW